MMVSEPMKWIEPMAKAGCNLFTFHIESDMPEGGAQTIITAVKKTGMKVGISIKPGTPVDAVFPFLENIDLALIMTVEPGFSGQKFMADMMPKVKTLRERCPTLNIEVDGGLSPSTVGLAAKAGANVVVSASAIFGSNDRKGTIKALRDSILKHGHGN